MRFLDLPLTLYYSYPSKAPCHVARKSVLKINGIELINHEIICQIIEKSIKLNFEKYISNICKKASNQLNAICGLTVQTFMGKKKKQ